MGVYLPQPPCDPWANAVLQPGDIGTPTSGKHTQQCFTHFDSLRLCQEGALHFTSPQESSAYRYDSGQLLAWTGIKPKYSDLSVAVWKGIKQ